MCFCRVVKLSNGLRALLISDPRAADPNPSRNGEHTAGAETTEPSCQQEQSSAQNDVSDASSVIESDDGNDSWTDISSHSDASASSAWDRSESDSAESAKRVGGKKRSQRPHSTSNVNSCTGEKLVRVGVL